MSACHSPQNRFVYGTLTQATLLVLHRLRYRPFAAPALGAFILRPRAATAANHLWEYFMTRSVAPWGRRLRRTGFALAAALLPLAAAHAAEGMWTLDRLPLKDLQA